MSKDTNFRVVCIDDSGKPNDIPLSMWVVKDKNYTIIQVDKLNVQGGKLGCKLAELNIDDYFPYQYFALDRFRPLQSDEGLADEAVEDLIKELELELL